MGPLGLIIKQRIESAGPISVAEYMALALTHPKHGYYTSGDPLGAAGDFVTAPEVGQVFGELIGAWCVVQWQAMGSPDAVNWVELGPGRGTLMADALHAARRMPGFMAAVRLHLVEANTTLRATQAVTLERAGLAQPPVWHATFDDTPDGPLLLVANEFFDALPVHVYQRTPEGWRERLVALDPDGTAFRFVLSAVLPTLPLPGGIEAGAGSVVEVAPAAMRTVHDIAARIVCHGGAALIIDYGRAVSAPGESLQAVRAHRPVPVLDDPGRADITAHVDFGALADAARTAGGAVWGPVGQGPFLSRLGIHERTERLARSAPPDTRERLFAALHRLTDPDEMGTLFKVMAITRGGEAPPGFAEPLPSD